MKRTVIGFVIGFIAALTLLAFANGAQADATQGCPAVISRGRVLLNETSAARFSECLYSRPRETVCGVNAFGWAGVIERRKGRKIVCVFAEPLIPEINGGTGQ